MPPPWRPRPSTRRPTISRSSPWKRPRGRLLAYDNIAVAEGPHPRKAYIQARDIQDAHQQFHILPDGPQIPRPPVGPLNPDPIDEKRRRASEVREPQPSPAPRARWDRGPTRCLRYSPAGMLPDLSQAGPAPGSARTGRERPARHRRREPDLWHDAPPVRRGGPASLIDPTVPGMGSTSVAASLGRTATTARAAGGRNATPPAPRPAHPSCAAPPSRACRRRHCQRPPASRRQPSDLPPLPVSIDLPPLPPN